MYTLFFFFFRVRQETRSIGKVLPSVFYTSLACDRRKTSIFQQWKRLLLLYCKLFICTVLKTFLLQKCKVPSLQYTYIELCTQVNSHVQKLQYFQYLNGFPLAAEALMKNALSYKADLNKSRKTIPSLRTGHAGSDSQCMDSGPNMKSRISRYRFEEVVACYCVK